MNLQRLYIDSPRIVKQSAGALLRFIPPEYLFGKKFREIRKYIKDTEFLSREKLLEIQLSRLREMLIYSYNNVPYYRRLFDKHGIKVEKIESCDEIRKIPLLDRQQVKENFETLQSTSFKKSLRSYATTGGTSGQPLKFYIDKARSSIEWAFLTYIWERIGYRLNDKRLVLRGEVIKNNRNKLWLYDPLLNQLSLSTFHMTEENLWNYLGLIQDFGPKFIHGYPSAIIVLAQFIRQNNITLKFKLKGIISISENIIKAQREYIEDTFKTRFFSFYGHSEKLILAAECEKSNLYHVQPQYGFAEIIDSKGEPVVEEGQVGELVGTGFINHAMPFIRYRTGDIVEYTSRQCECGRDYLLLKTIRGRWLQEMLVTKKNSLISITALNVHSDIFDKVIKFQFEQDEPGKAILKIIKSPDYSETDTKSIIKELNAKLDSQIDLQLDFVENIPSTQIGKSIFLKQNIDISNLFPV